MLILIEIFDFIKEAIGLLFDLVETSIELYLKKFWKVSKWMLCLLAGLISIFAIGSAFKIHGLIVSSVAMIAIVVPVWLILAIPIIAPTQIVYEKMGSLQRSVKLVAGITLWLYQLILYFSIVPVENAPWAIPLVAVLAASLVLFYFRYGLVLTPKIAFWRTIVLLFIITFIFFVPAAQFLVQAAANKINDRITVWILWPNKLAYQPNMVIFNPVTSKPRLWYYHGNNGDCDYEIFDRPGYHPTYQKQLLPITVEVEIKMRDCYEAQKKAEAEIEARKKAEIEAKKKAEIEARKKAEIEAKKNEENKPTAEWSQLNPPIQKNNDRPIESAETQAVKEIPSTIKVAEPVLPLPPLSITFTMDPNQRRRWLTIPVKANIEYDFVATGQVCWSKSDPEG